jgi:hypothetical protein
MKNKRWKRKAKRLVGECVKHWDCTNFESECKYFDACPIMNDYLKYIGNFNLRDIENYFKGKEWK